MNIDCLKEYEHIVIYGAGMIAKSVFCCLTGAPFFLSVSSFMVSEKEKGVNKYMGIPVISVYEGTQYKKNTLILIAVMDIHYDEIQQLLEKEKFEHTAAVTFESPLWEMMREEYVAELFRCQNRTYFRLKRELDASGNCGEKSLGAIKIYRTCCHTDKMISADILKYDWETPIQAGAALTKQRISVVCDNQGENISEKNREYCELTALYWIWKNDFAEYVGICHYRRHFQLNRKLLQELAASDIDVVLTTPILNFPNVREVYVHDHVESDWDTMLEAVKRLQPDYYETAQQLQQGVFYYAYNMMIARKTILNDYCEWLFPILSYCEENCARKTEDYQNRYIGFLSERLMSIYFLYHDNRYKIAHARKLFLK